MLRHLLQSFRKVPFSVRVLWLMAALALPLWAHFDDTGWDMKVYDHALVSLHNHHDPYQDATDIQKQHHRERTTNGQIANDNAPPYSYVYAPVTLPVLRALGHLPRTILIALYLLLYIAGAFAAVVVFATCATPSEFPGVLFFAGLAVFFPGLLANGVILSGNVAYILYGAVLAAALLGWRRDRWRPFYVAVLAATCVKAPLLSLVLVAPLSSTRQWRNAGVVIAAGLGIYAVQPLVVPQLFRHYLEAVELQFSFNHDFGCSPAGLFSNLLYQRGLPYAPGCYFLYFAYAVPVFASLVYGARLHARNQISLRQWAPVLLVGVVLLNPRIVEYDAAPITVPMALIVWRTVRSMHMGRIGYGFLAAVFLAMTGLSVYNWLLRKAMDGPLILITFVAGMWLIRQAARSTETLSPEGLHELTIA